MLSNWDNLNIQVHVIILGATLNNLLEQPNIVEQILQKLSEVDSIPNDGFLAGGAVANTLLNMKYKKIRIMILPIIMIKFNQISF